MTVNIHDSALGVTVFMNSHGYTVPVLRDTQHDMSLQYGVSAAPVTFFIDGNGIIKYIKRGAFESLSEVQNDFDKLI